MKIKKVIIIMTALVVAGISLAIGAQKSGATVFAAGGDTEESTVSTSEGESAASTGDTDTDHIYGVGSVSKVYVTTAVMQLVEQGKVDLDLPVTEYIDDFTMADERYKDITVRMLMNHSSGLAGTSVKNFFLYGDNDYVATDSVLKNLKTQSLKADPGEYACYCNDGFELLEIIVERVSGMNYTDYVKKNIADKIGAENIYTAGNVFENPDLAEIYPNGHNRYETEYCMGFGTGGIYSTAADTCEFGSTFFAGDNRLLSEESKNKMATLWSSDPKMSVQKKYDTKALDQNGLGWDLVDIPMYEDAGVKALFKGGDTQDYHAALLVMPEEEISVCVTTAEGGSGFNLAMAEALANIALEEQGIFVEETKAPEVELKDSVPESYKQYEGLYSLDGSPAEITFPDMKYAQVKTLGLGTSDSYYMYSDSGFVKVTGDIEERDMRVDPDYYCLNFEETDGKIYLIKEMLDNHSGLIGTYQKIYAGEKLKDNPVSEKVLKAWQERNGQKYDIISGTYSSALFDAPFGIVSLIGESGYAQFTIMGKTYAMKIVDANHVASCTTIPSSVNRDLFEISIDGDGIAHSTYGFDCAPESENEKFTSETREVSLITDKAVWFRIDDSMANKNISIERSDQSAVYVYDKYGKVKYSTHMTDYGNIIHLPQDGYIMFAGETGDTITIR